MAEESQEVPEIEILSSQAEKFDGEPVDVSSEKVGSEPPVEPTVLSEAEEWKKKYEEMKDRLMWVAADFDNFKKRVQKDKEEHLKFSQTGLLKEFLPVLDNLERALGALKGHEQEATPAFAALKQGVELVLRQFQTTLEKHGVTVIPALGTSFDPRIHEVMVQTDSSDHPDETVLEVFQTGYFLHDRVLRPAQVKVSKKQK